MPWGIASSTDSKVADIIGMSPSKTKTTLGCQTMMCCMTRCCLCTGRTGVHGAEEAMMTKIQANVAMGVGRGRVWALDQDSGCWGGDPLAFSNLDMDDIISVHWIDGRRGGWGQNAKGQRYGGRWWGMVSDFFQILMLFCSDERVEDLGESRIESSDGELLQIVVEGVCYNFLPFSCLLSYHCSMTPLLLLCPVIWGDQSLLTHLLALLFLLDHSSLVSDLVTGLSLSLTTSLIIVMFPQYSILFYDLPLR